MRTAVNLSQKLKTFCPRGAIRRYMHICRLQHINIYFYNYPDVGYITVFLYFPFWWLLVSSDVSCDHIGTNQDTYRFVNPVTCVVYGFQLCDFVLNFVSSILTVVNFVNFDIKLITDVCPKLGKMAWKIATMTRSLLFKAMKTTFCS